MNKSTIRIKLIVVALMFAGIAASMAGCGGSMMATSRQLQSIMVTPAMATATSTSGGVQFTATGMYNMNPMSEMSPPVVWSFMPFGSAQPQPAGVTLDANGMAHCSGFVGTIPIIATAPMDPNMSLSMMTMMTRNVSGMAQLTCQ